MSAHGNEAAPAFFCRCEELTAEELLNAIAAGARTINDVKRRTRAGMGMCQGVYCLNHVAELIAIERGQPREQVSPMTARPPARALTLAALAALTGQE